MTRRFFVALYPIVVLATIATGSHFSAQTAASLTSTQGIKSPSSTVKGGFELRRSNYKFAERDWNAMISALHTAKPPSDEQTYPFVMAMVAGEPDSGAQSPEDEALAGVSVCSAGFFKISESGSYSLVASLDVNGRHFCNDVEVIHRGASGLTIQNVWAREADDVNEIVRDLDKNGKKELVIPSELSGYAGARCSGAWNEIFGLRSGILVDRSAEFKDFYKAQLAPLEAGMQEARKKLNDGDGDRAVCLKMEADKIERFLGISPNAGENKAIEWANSGDEYLRGRGFAVLADIRDRRSIAVLQRFAKDPNPWTAQEAKSLLRRIKK